MNFYPNLSDVGTYKDEKMSFGGYNHTLSCSDGEWYRQTNMSAKQFPVLSPRGKRGHIQFVLNEQGMIAVDNGLLVIDNGEFYLNGEQLTVTREASLTPGKKKLVRMGANVCIFPDGCIFDTQTNTLKRTYWYGNAFEAVTFAICDEKGNILSPIYSDGFQSTHDAISGDYWVTTSNGKAVVKRYNGASWSTVNKVCTTIGGFSGLNAIAGSSAEMTIHCTNEADYKKIESLFPTVNENGTRFGNAVIVKADERSITIEGCPNVATPQVEVVILNVVSEVKEMKYVVECGNRLWGCSEDGHEIYASKLGDPTSWNSFQGLSIDSYAATVGSEGVFTGATVYGSNPIFFKENSILTVYPSSTGAHAYKEMTANGVQNGSADSIRVVDNILYYKGVDGVYSYNGNMPNRISQALGDEKYYEASAGVMNEVYYISMQDASSNQHLFTYDTHKNIWSREDATEINYPVTYSGDLYFIDHQHTVCSMGGTKLFGNLNDESEIKWSADSGVVGFGDLYHKYLKKIRIRAMIPLGARFSVKIEYDSSGVWENIFTIVGKGTRTIEIPIRPKRCDHLRYRLEGIGDVKVFGILKVMQEGS